jgi:hypothetical protein
MTYPKADRYPKAHPKAMLAPNTADHALTPPSGNEGFTSDFGGAATVAFGEERYAWSAIWTMHAERFQ